MVAQLCHDAGEPVENASQSVARAHEAGDQEHGGQVCAMGHASKEMVE